MFEITSYYYAGSSNSPVCVASCWSGSNHICPAERSMSFLVAVHRPLSTSSAQSHKGSVLGPLLFIVYTADLADIAEKHGVSLHAFAYDIQSYLHCRRTDTTSAAAQLNDVLQMSATECPHTDSSSTWTRLSYSESDQDAAFPS